jgi:hypothetical protein
MLPLTELVDEAPTPEPHRQVTMSEQLERALGMQRQLEGLLKQGKTHLMELR